MKDKYIAFCYPPGNAAGGWRDCVGVFDTLEAAYHAVEEKATKYGYWQHAEGEIVLAGGSICEPIRYFACLLQGDVYGSTITQFAWAMSKNDRILQEVRNLVR